MVAEIKYKRHIAKKITVITTISTEHDIKGQNIRGVIGFRVILKVVK